MSSAPPTGLILISGATADTGTFATQELRAAGHKVRCLVHKEDDRSKALADLGAEVITADFLDSDSIRQAMVGVSAAYFNYPITHGILEATTYFADAAKRNNVKLVVNLSQKSAREDSESHAARAHWLSERIFDNWGVPTTHLRSTFFSQWLLYPYIRPTIIKEGVIRLPYGKGRHAPISAEDQGRVIAKLLVLADAKQYGGKIIPLFGPVELNEDGIAAAVGEVLERKIIYSNISIPEYQAMLAKAGLPPHLIQHLSAVAIDCQNGVFAGEDSFIKEFTGQSPMTVQEFVKKHRAALESLDHPGVQSNSTKQHE